MGTWGVHSGDDDGTHDWLCEVDIDANRKNKSNEYVNKKLAKLIREEPQWSPGPAWILIKQGYKLDKKLLSVVARVLQKELAALRVENEPGWRDVNERIRAIQKELATISKLGGKAPARATATRAVSGGRHCGKCGQAGHYKSTCSKRAKASKATKAHYDQGFVDADGGFDGYAGTFYHGGRTGKTEHDKVWSYRVESKGNKSRVVVQWGRRLGPKQTKAHPWTSHASALAKASALLRSKLAKGYSPVGF